MRGDITGIVPYVISLVAVVVLVLRKLVNTDVSLLEKLGEQDRNYIHELYSLPCNMLCECFK